VSPADPQRIAELFTALSDMSSPDQQAFLRSETGGSGPLFDELTTLLEAAQRAPDFFDTLSSSVVGPALSTLAAEPRRYAAGDRIGRYEIDAWLGGGGNGQVYRAQDVTLDRAVALKFLATGAGGLGAEATERLVREAKALSACEDPRVCVIHAIERTDEGAPYLVMAFYPGQTLADKLRRGPLPPDQALIFAREMALGLAAAHRKGIVHRDLKPANVHIGEGDHVRLLDFGIAHVLGDRSLTRTGSTLGTIRYMAPEQIRGEAVDERADLWALGVVLFEMLRGEPPFGGETEAETLYSVLERDPHLPSELPRGLASLLGALLAKDPRQRPTQAADVAARLDALLGSGQTNAAASKEKGAASALGNALTSVRTGRVGGRALALAGVAVAAAAFFFVARPVADPARTGALLDQAAVVVLPFHVAGDPALAYLGDGLVDLLGTKLEGSTTLRAIDPNAVLGQLPAGGGRPLRIQDGQRLAERFGASRFVLGQVLRVGSSLQVGAVLYDAGGEELARADASAESESGLLPALDAVAQQLIASEYNLADRDMAALAATTTHSLDALRAYLAGENSLRAGRPLDAIAHLEAAVVEDSLFALAWYRLARAAGWIGPDSLNRVATVRALALSGALPAGPRAMIEAYATFRTGDPLEAEEQLRSLVALRPDDTEARLVLGEALFHNGPYFGRSTREVREPFEAVLAYDADNREAMVHLLDVAAQSGDSLEVARLAQRFLQASPDGTSPAVHAAYSALRTWSAQPASQRRVTDTLVAAGADALRQALERVVPQLDDLALARRVAEALTQPDSPGMQASWGHLHLGLFAAVSGELEEADAHWRIASALRPAEVLTLQSLVLGSPLIQADAERIRSLREQVRSRATWETPIPATLYPGDPRYLQVYLDGVLSWRLEDEAAVREAITTLQAAGAQADGGAPDCFARTLAALLAWDRGAWDEGLAVLDGGHVSLPFSARARSPALEAHLARFVRAELLEGAGRSVEARAWRASLPDGYFHWGLPYVGDATCPGDAVCVEN